MVSPRFFAAAGNAASVGHACGEMAPQFIQTMARQLPTEAAFAKAHRVYHAMLEYMAAHFPDTLDEIRGLANGAGIDEQDALRLTFHQSLGELSLPMPHACSAIAWRDDGGVYLFKTDDGPPFADAGAIDRLIADRLTLKCLFDLQIEGRQRVLGVGQFGRVLIEAGVNASGLIMGHTSGRPVLAPQDGFGIPQHVFPGLVLGHCRTVDEAVAFARQHPVAGKGINITVADPSGAMAAIEKCGPHTAIRRGARYAFVVNHQIDPAMARLAAEQVPGFVGSDYHANSDARRAFIERGMTQTDCLAALMGDGEGKVCQCGANGDGSHNLGTNYAVLMHAGRNTLRFYPGVPRMERYEDFAMARAVQTAS